jgi:hypothetical protein
MPPQVLEKIAKEMTRGMDLGMKNERKAPRTEIPDPSSRCP